MGPYGARERLALVARHGWWGGTLAEHLDRVAVAFCPLDTFSAKSLISRSGLSEVLGGVRGSCRDGRAELEGWLIRLSQFVWSNKEQVSELELNPVVMSDRGLVALDSLVRIR